MICLIYEYVWFFWLGRSDPRKTSYYQLLYLDGNSTVWKPKRLVNPNQNILHLEASIPPIQMLVCVFKCYMYIFTIVWNDNPQVTILRRGLTLVATCSCFMLCFTRVLTARADRLLRPNALWVSAWYSWLRHKHGTEKPSCWATYKRPKFIIFVPETLPSFGCSYPGEVPNHCRLMNYDRYNLPRIYHN